MRQQMGLQMIQVTCPDHLDVPVGGNFPCDAVSSYGWTGDIYVTVTDADGRYQWQLAE